MLNKLRSIINNDKVQNVNWLLFDKLFRMITGFVVTIYLARYLGPEKFGVINYSIALLVIANTFSSMGLIGLVVKELINNIKNKHEILGTVFTIRFIGSIITLILLSIYVMYNHSGYSLITFIIILSVVFQSFETTNLYFEANLENKYIALSRIISFFLSSVIKLILVFISADLYLFAIAVFVEYSFKGILVVLYYNFLKENIFKWKFDFRLAKELLRRSWPLIFSSLAAILYLKIDQVMLNNMVGENEVGIYSAAVQLSEVWYFVPTAIVTVIFPKIIKVKRENTIKYKEYLWKWYVVLIFLSISLSILVSLTSDLIINILYGNQYIRSSLILTIHIWAGVFVFIRALLSKWLINEDLYMFSLISHSTGALINIVMNIILIPKIGAEGAAIATIISYIFSTYIFCFFSNKTRYMGIIISRALIAPLLILFNPSKIKELKGL